MSSKAKDSRASNPDYVIFPQYIPLLHELFSVIWEPSPRKNQERVEHKMFIEKFFGYVGNIEMNKFLISMGFVKESEFEDHIYCPSTYCRWTNKKFKKWFNMIIYQNHHYRLSSIELLELLYTNLITNYGFKFPILAKYLTRCRTVNKVPILDFRANFDWVGDGTIEQVDIVTRPVI